MLISVITVCYNSACSIETTLKSVISQNYPHVEYIVIDGSSKDGTLKILQDYSNNIDSIISEPDFGIYDAMNKGLKLATGDIICFLNSDDQFESQNTLSEIYREFDGSNCDVVLADVVFVASDNPNVIKRRYPAHRFKPHLFRFGWMPPHPGVFAKKSVYRKVGFFDVSYKIAGDFEYLIRVFSLSGLNFKYANKVSVKMQLGGVSNSSLKNLMLLNFEVLRACKSNGINTNIIFILSKYLLKIYDKFLIKIH